VYRTLIVTAAGLGKLRPAPGTWGSLPPCALAFGLVAASISPLWINLALFLLLLFSCISCVALGSWGEQKYRAKDPGVIVIDEVAGMSLSLLFIPLAPFVSPSSDAAVPLMSALVVIGAAFLLFRIVDVVKPPPAGAAQQFPAGWGILADDLVAGLMVNLLLQVFLRFVLPILAG